MNTVKCKYCSYLFHSSNDMRWDTRVLQLHIRGQHPAAWRVHLRAMNRFDHQLSRRLAELSS